MTHPENSTSASSDTAVPRRGVMRGVAWTIPVVAAAAAAPAIAASTPCPDISTSEGWYREGSPLYTGGNVPGGHPIFWPTPTEFHQGDDNTSSTEEAWGFGQINMPVVAGETYTFTFGVGKTTFTPTDGSPDTDNLGQHLLFTVGGEQLAHFFTRPLGDHIQITSELPAYTDFSFSWTAPADAGETTVVRFDFVMPPKLPESSIGGDDVRITLPRVSVSGGCSA
jgi:hypothetical protein